jgi:hypothetical protein
MSKPINIYNNKNENKIINYLDTLKENIENTEDENTENSDYDLLDKEFLKEKTTKMVKNNSYTNLSFSICIDSKITKTSDKNMINSPPENDFLLTKLKNIYPKSDGKWINADLILSCQSCGSTFGLFNRKHHCRACGSVFCKNCCYQMIKIPKKLIKKPEEDDTYKQKISNITKWILYKQKNLVCNDCYIKITNLNKITWKIKICEFLDYNSLNKILFCSKSWYKAGIHQLSKFREIQYNINILYTNWQQNMIWSSKRLFIGHSNWIIILIKSTLQNYYKIYDKNIIYELTKIIEDNNKNISCWSLMCSRKCNIDYDLLDYIDILKFVSLLEEDKKILWSDVLIQELLLLLLRNILNIELKYKNVFFPEYDEIYDKLKATIPLLCSIIINLIGEENIINSLFLHEMFNEFIHIDNCILNFYLETKYIQNIQNINVSHIYFMNFIENIMKKYNLSPMIIKINKMISFFTNLYNDNNTELTESILNPLNLNEQIIEIIKIEKLKSNTCPLLLTTKVIRNTKFIIVKLIIKKDESLRKESIVACLIKLLQDRLYKQAEKNRIKIFDKIPTYQIIMLGKNLSIIEYVEESLTLRMISKNNFTLQNYILENNPTIQVDLIKRKFLQSLAISSSLSYILGLGDRHLDNIMINKHGQLFHIDYGYLMDNPTTSIISNPNIKITTVMIDFLGGVEGKYYKEFTQYIIQIYDILRLYKNLIINYFEIIGKENFINWNVFKPKLENRFLMGLSWKDIEITLINEIENSNSYSGVFADLCHHYKQLATEFINKNIK